MKHKPSATPTKTNAASDESGRRACTAQLTCILLDSIPGPLGRKLARDGEDGQDG